MLVDQRVVLFLYSVCWCKFLLPSMYQRNTFTTLSGCFGDNLKVLLALKNYTTLPNLSTWWNLILCVKDVIDQFPNILRLRIFTHPLAYLIYFFIFCDFQVRITLYFCCQLKQIRWFLLQYKIHFWIFHPC
jgi:hypothetical protein